MSLGHPGIALSQLYKGLPFSLTLLLILLCHEFGHYFMAKKHRGRRLAALFHSRAFAHRHICAMIKMRSPLYSKRALLDVGAADLWQG